MKKDPNRVLFLCSFWERRKFRSAPKHFSHLRSPAAGCGTRLRLRVSAASIPTYLKTERRDAMPTRRDLECRGFLLACSPFLLIGFAQRCYHFAIHQRINETCPRLHHVLALGQVLRLVVTCPDRVSFLVCQLPLDPVRRITHFVQHSGRSGTETVRGKLSLVSHALQRPVKRCRRHADFRSTMVREQ